MHQITRSPFYLIRNPHSYCFRINIPKDLQPIIGKKELRRSLKTRYLSVVKAKARVMAAIFKCCSGASERRRLWQISPLTISI
jgi:hypothetical protein